MSERTLTETSTSKGARSLRLRSKSRNVNADKNIKNVKIRLMHLREAFEKANSEGNLDNGIELRIRIPAAKLNALQNRSDANDCLRAIAFMRLSDNHKALERISAVCKRTEYTYAFPKHSILDEISTALSSPEMIELWNPESTSSAEWIEIYRENLKDYLNNSMCELSFSERKDAVESNPDYKQEQK